MRFYTCLFLLPILQLLLPADYSLFGFSSLSWLFLLVPCQYLALISRKLGNSISLFLFAFSPSLSLLFNYPLLFLCLYFGSCKLDFCFNFSFFSFVFIISRETKSGLVEDCTRSFIIKVLSHSVLFIVSLPPLFRFLASIFKTLFLFPSFISAQLPTFFWWSFCFSSYMTLIDERFTQNYWLSNANLINRKRLLDLSSDSWLAEEWLEDWLAKTQTDWTALLFSNWRFHSSI